MNEEQEHNQQQDDAELNAMLHDFWGEELPEEAEQEQQEQEQEETETPPDSLPPKPIPAPPELPFPPQNKQQIGQEAVNQFIQNQYAGMMNPYTGQPIQNLDEHNAFMFDNAKNQLTELLNAGGVTSEAAEALIRQLVTYHPDVLQAQTEQSDYQQLLADSEMQQADSFAQQQIQALQQKYPGANIQSLADLAKTQEGQQALQYWAKGIPLDAAYAAAFAGQLAEHGQKAAMQQARNQMQSVGHLMQAQGNGGNEPSMSAEDIKNWREFYPDISDQELQKKWKKFHK